MRELFFFLVIFFYLSDVFAYQIKEAPHWVADNAVSSNNVDFGASNKSSVYHLVDKQLYLSKRQQHQYYRFISTPLNGKGLEENGKISITFSEAYEKVELHHAHIYRGGQRLDVLNDMRISEFRTENQVDLDLYNGSLTVNAIIKDLRAGDKLDIAYSIIGSNPVLGTMFSTGYGLAWTVPVEKLSIRVVDAGNRGVYSKVLNSSAEPIVKNTRLGVEHSVTIAPTDTFYREEGAPRNIIQEPAILFTNINSWNDIGAWGKTLFKFNEKRQSSEWKSWVKDVASQPTDEAKVLKALSLVQNKIRYVGIEIGENSHKPRDPSEVINNRYGDCKDKTLLLMSLLESNGIKTSPVFVSSATRGGVTYYPPSISAFDHVILEVILGSKNYWLDGTVSYQKANRVSSLGFVNYEAGLSISRPDKLSSMPVKNFSIPEIDIIEKYYLRSTEAPVYLEVDVKYSGYRADYQRNYFGAYNLQEIGRKYREYYSKYYSNVTRIGEITYDDSSRENYFNTSERYLLSDFVKKNKEGKYYYSIRPNEIFSFLSVPDLEERKTPFYIGEPVKVNYRIEVHYSIQNLFHYEPVELDFGDQYRSLKVDTWDVGKKSVYHYQYQSYLPSVLPKDISVHKEMIEKIKKDIGFTYNLSDYDEKKEIPVGNLYKYLDKNFRGAWK